MAVSSARPVSTPSMASSGRRCCEQVDGWASRPAPTMADSVPTAALLSSSLARSSLAVTRLSTSRACRCCERGRTEEEEEAVEEEAVGALVGEEASAEEEGVLREGGAGEQQVTEEGSQSVSR